MLFLNEVENVEKEKDYGWNKGEESEEKVRQALEELKAEGIIKNFGQSLKFYQEDLRGRDFLITIDNGRVIWLQVKSSFNAVDKEKYLRRGIHYIAVEQKTLGEIKKEILEILEKSRKRTKIKEKIEV